MLKTSETVCGETVYALGGSAGRHRPCRCECCSGVENKKRHECSLKRLLRISCARPVFTLKQDSFKG